MLFLLGGLVRVTGSGMGCPDWPKCFGLLAPPTCSCQLPPGYQKIFLEKRIAKVKRFTGMLDKWGFHNKAEAIRSDKTILLPEEFNASKAWIEYINRLFGVLSGLLVLAFAIMAVFRVRVFKTTAYALLALLMLVLNAWIGSVVVATNLLPGLVTLHFMLSFLCVFFIMLSMNSARAFTVNYNTRQGRFLWLILFTVVMIEVLMGALARENVELLRYNGQLVANDGMLDYKALETFFTFHRFVPAFLFAVSILAGLRVRKKSMSEAKAFFIFSLLCLLQIALGAFNIVFVLPPAAQVSHIVIGAILPVWAFYYNLVRDTAQNT